MNLSLKFGQLTRIGRGHDLVFKERGVRFVTCHVELATFVLSFSGWIF